MNLRQALGLKTQGPSGTCNESKEEEEVEGLGLGGLGSRVKGLRLRG